MARIISQDGKSIYNFENVLSVRCIGKSIKLMLQMPMYDPNDEQRLPQIVIAEYKTEERAQKELDKFIAKLALSSGGIWQFPAEGE